MSIDQRILESLGPTAAVRDARRLGPDEILLVIDAAPAGETNRYLMSAVGTEPLRYQSAMSLARRDRLLLHYEQLMALAFLFHGSPRRALLLGLGGGTVWRYLRRAYPSCAVTAVERSPAVIEVARRWFGVDGQITQADAGAFLASAGGHWDAILVDLYGARGLSHQPVQFWRHCAAALSPEGVVAINWADFAGVDASRRTAAALAALFADGLYAAARDRRDNVVQFCAARALPSPIQLAQGLPAPQSMPPRRISLERCLFSRDWPD